MNEIGIANLIAARQGVSVSEVSIEMQGPRSCRARTPHGSFFYFVVGADAPPGEEVSLESYSRGGHIDRDNHWS